MSSADDGPLTILIAGLGGQGVILAGDALCDAALLAGLSVKKSEIHGLSRRFGSVSCQVRIGHELYSPLRGHGGVDLLLAFEGYEALKQLPYLAPDGVALANEEWRLPGAARAVEAPQHFGADDPRISWFNGTAITHQAECPRSLNFFMLGVLSARLPIHEMVWRETFEGSSRLSAVNYEMFVAGRRRGRVAAWLATARGRRFAAWGASRTRLSR
jgi:indolepyruvate ferredoxin oxidoreductase beta subunit